MRKIARRGKSRIAILIAAMSLGIVFTACKTVVKENSSVTSAPPPSETPVGQVNEGAFYVQAITPETVQTYFHEQNGFIENSCKVSVLETDLTKKDIYCILDIQELDLFHQGIELNFNSPTTMCPYVRVRPYWFYDYYPSDRIYDLKVTLKDGSIETMTYKDSAGDVTIDPADYPISIGSSGELIGCKFDYTLSEGPNCCQGTYQVNGTDSAGAVVAVEKTDLGGKITNCMAGPGIDFLLNKNGFPIPKDYPTAKTGINDKITLNTPAAQERSGNLYLANYFKPSSWGSKNDLFPFSDGLYPAGMKGPLTDQKYQGFPYYEFGCLDQASDYIARIRVLIRAWDKISEFTNNNNPYTDPSAGDEPQFDDSYHDKKVWHDLESDDPVELGKNAKYGLRR